MGKLKLGACGGLLVGLLVILGACDPQRVSKLEDDMKEVKASLKSIELSVAEIKHLPKMSDFNVLRTDISDVKGRMGITEGKLAGIEGRLQHIPNTWQIIGILFGVAAVLYTASRVLR